MFRTRLLTALAFSCLATVATVAAAATVSPAATVERLHTALTESMADAKKLGCEGRMKKMQPVVEAGFDLPFIAEKALRRHWTKLDETQRESFKAALARSVITTYATEFAAPAAVSFTTGGTDTLANGDAVVHTTLVPQKGDSVTLDYVLKPRGEAWQIVNVLAEGVSDLALRATQYDGLMKNKGFDALLPALEAQTARLKARCP